MVLVGDAAVRLVFPASIQYGLPETGVRTLRNSQLHLNVPGQDQCSGLYELCHLDWPSEVPGNLTIADDIASCGRPYQATQVDADGITLDISHAMGVHPDFGNEVVDLTLVAGDKDVYGTPACPMTDTGADGAYVLFTQTIRTLGKAT
ncbi:hypothetical protein GNI_140300 [Gregarina niphandrodes]|uniref:Uncharacterized protein n=1 Tax=Gregarina niphandrodes TaxID=110365 RepID=A0A023B0A6_GRENI|nr:hypothetical protein GNI_140300 [Gregarina niphandrodes]EZG45144.1 hypothetical protein GNI_140300 [Gregarina niphandrodes]|eukprot:XP_011132545.1 hypothetical protein GNI_140300 [Gregarina niphandrodes]